MQIRKPIVAGQFYPAWNDSCIDRINEFLDTTTLPANLPEVINAAIVPHAGWTFSGQLAATAFSAIRQRHEKVNTFIILGAAHRCYAEKPVVYETGFWQSPLGEIAIDQELANEILRTGQAEPNPSAHNAEHSIEVQIPFIQYLFPGAKIVPIIMPVDETAISFGKSLGETIAKNKNKKIICIGSTDLSHYGPDYGFIPKGIGPEAIKWAHQVNDKEFIDHTLRLDATAMLESARKNANACGPAAAAATVEAAKTLGVKKGLLLAQTNSNQVLKEIGQKAGNNSVGYAAIVL